MNDKNDKDYDDNEYNTYEKNDSKNKHRNKDKHNNKCNDSFQSQSQFWSIVLTNSHCQLQCQLLYQVGALQLPNDLHKQHNVKLSNHPDINMIIE